MLREDSFYRLVGDQEMTDSCHYWELCPLADWKSFSVGVAYRTSLGRFDQLGKNSGSWCLHASQWLQTSLSVKHNNRAKALDSPLPQRIGIYCDYNNGTTEMWLCFVFKEILYYRCLLSAQRDSLSLIYIHKLSSFTPAATSSAPQPQLRLSVHPQETDSRHLPSHLTGSQEAH